MPSDWSLPQGAVFYMAHRNLRSPMPHYLIVLNADAGSDTVIVLSVISSQIEKSRMRAALRRYAPGTLVECSPTDYWPLRKNSIIDCNTCMPVPAHLFRQDVVSGTRCANIPPDLLRRILEGVRLSNLSDELKKMLGIFP